jgi:hypothetical protein
VLCFISLSQDVTIEEMVGFLVNPPPEGADDKRIHKYVCNINDKTETRQRTAYVQMTGVFNGTFGPAAASLSHMTCQPYPADPTGTHIWRARSYAAR